jgi:SagB-type dehydrogenase family enzyme
MKRIEVWLFRWSVLSQSLVFIVLSCWVQQGMTETRIKLPEPAVRDGTALTDALAKRRSVRDYSGREISLEQLAQLLWSAQGINHPSGLRTAPSAGALYPLELLVVADRVAGLDRGVYRYRVDQHVLELVTGGNIHGRLAKAAMGQAWVSDSAAVLVITAIYERTTRKYGHRGKRYVHIEVGHAAQNVLLQAVALGLGAGMAGAFDDAVIARLLALPASEHPLYLLPVGWPEGVQ